MDDVSKIIRQVAYNDLEAILISCGCNDMDHKGGSDVHDEMVETIRFVRQTYPHIKIIISEVTPRKDNRDAEVIVCNEKLNESVKEMENVTIINHYNLRDDDMTMFMDAKHIKEECISKYASNIKIGLRKAFGITRTPNTDYNNRNIRNHRDSINTQNTYNSHTSGYMNTNTYNDVRLRNDRYVDTRLKQVAGYENYPVTENKNKNEILQQAINALQLLVT